MLGVHVARRRALNIVALRLPSDALSHFWSSVRFSIGGNGDVLLSELSLLGVGLKACGCIEAGLMSEPGESSEVGEALEL